MTQEQVDKFWEPLFAIGAYAQVCTDKLEKAVLLPAEDLPGISALNSQQDARSTILVYLPKIKERIIEIEELLLTEEKATES